VFVDVLDQSYRNRCDYTLPLRTITLNIFKGSTRFGKLPEHASNPSLYTCMKALLCKLGPFLNWLMYLSEGLDICASMHPRLYPDVDADSSILEIAFCFPNGALPSVEFIVLYSLRVIALVVKSYTI
jgi:hypothetical protein